MQQDLEFKGTSSRMGGHLSSGKVREMLSENVEII
jgi:hypothetical protein